MKKTAVFLSLVFAVTSQLFADGSMLTVKGLYIGMNLDDASRVYKEKFENLTGKPAWIRKIGSGEYELFPDENGARAGWWGSICITADPDRTVCKIEITSYFADKIFNSGDMNAKEFATAFCNAYEIPEMEYSSNDECWTYSSPSGYKLVIKKDHWILIERIVKAADTKFD